VTTTAPTVRADSPAPRLAYANAALLYGLLVWPAVAGGAHQGWPLAATQLLALLGLLGWILRMLADRRLEWRRTALDLPAALLIVLVLAQLALGNRPLRAWGLAPPPADPAALVELPAPFLALGTVSPDQTAQSLGLFLTYASAYVLVVNLIRRRGELDRLVRTLLLVGGLLSFLGLIDYLSREAWLLGWRGNPSPSRLSGTFVNPDHWASWLGMLTCLGIGYLAARRGSDHHGPSLAGLINSRRQREAAIRRYLPFVGIGLTSLALVFTLSRGAVASLLITLVALLVLLGRSGRLRWSLALLAALAAITLACGVGIGLAPFLARLGGTDYGGRLIQWLTTLPMLTAFPTLGVGLGAYKDIYFHYQPPALAPGKVYFPYAHNDVLQLAVELGVAGTALVVFAAWRVARDLVAGHLFGRGGCPVAAGEGRGRRRNDPWSLGIALGALGGVGALSVHSLFDFSARIPANGILGAACLGIATVALHTRFTAKGEQHLAATRSRALGPGRLLPAAAGTAAIVAAAALTWPILAPAVVLARLPAPGEPAPLARIEDALAVDRGNARLLRARAELRLEAVRRIWSAGAASGDRVFPPLEEARPLDLLNGAVEDVRLALSRVPSDPFLHELLARAHATATAIDPSRRSAHWSEMMTHARRAIALAPDNPFLYRTLAALAMSGPAPMIEVGLRSSREAVQRDPALLPALVDRFLPLNLAADQWVAMVPDGAVDRLELGGLLESRGFLNEAALVYRRAREAASGGEGVLARWALATLLIDTERYEAAVIELEAALRLDPENPELHLARAHALAGIGDPAALPAYRAALAAAEARVIEPSREGFVWGVPAPRAQALARLGRAAQPRPTRYRRAFAQYLTDQKLWGEALAEWNRALGEAPLDASGHFSRGVALDGTGGGAAAIEAYRKAVSLDGKRLRFRLRLAERLWDADQYYQAIDEWRAVSAGQPGNLEVLLPLARAYVRVGEQSLALREYQRILTIAPEQVEAQQAWARLRQVP